jgi:hypothetical protein
VRENRERGIKKGAKADKKAFARGDEEKTNQNKTRQLQRHHLHLIGAGFVSPNALIFSAISASPRDELTFLGLFFPKGKSLFSGKTPFEAEAVTGMLEGVSGGVEGEEPPLVDLFLPF